MGPKSEDNLQTYLPLRPADLQTLLVLSDGPRHGYGIMKAVEEQSGQKVTLEIGSLYRLLGRLQKSGLVEDANGNGGDGRGEPRRYYRITQVGQRVAKAELERLNEVVQMARSRRFLADTKGA